MGTCFPQHLPVRIFARGVTQGSGEMIADTSVIPRSLEGPLEVPMVGNMNHSTPANEGPCQGKMPKARSPSIPKDMAVLASLYMQRH